MQDTIKIVDVKIRDGFNVRETNGELFDEDTQQLAESIKLIGVLTPVLLDEDGYLVAGHRRIEASKLAGVKEVPYTIVTGDDKRRLAAHGAENVARKNLSPSEEAELIGRHLDAGYTEDGAAQILGISKGLVTRRKVLLELPVKMRVFWGPHGSMPLELVPSLAAIVSKVPEIGEIILHAEQSRAQKSEPRSQQEIDELREQAYEDGYEDDAYLEDDEIGEVPPLIELLSRPVQYLNTLQRLYTPPQGKRPSKGTPRWPADVIVCTEGVFLSDANLVGLGIPEKMRERVIAALHKLHDADVWNVSLRVGEYDMDAARAAGVTIVLGELEFIYDLTWLKARIKSDIIPSYEEAAKNAAANKREQKSASKAEKEGRPLTEYEQADKDKRQRTRDKEKEWKPRAAAVNAELGAALLNKFGTVKVDPKIAKIFAEASLGSRDGDTMAYLAAAGMRYVMPGWETVVPTPTKANPDKTKTEYLETDQAVKKVWEWFDQAKTVEEIFGRATVIHAAAMFANEHVLPMSRRSPMAHNWEYRYKLPGTSASGPSGQLRAMVEKSVPAQVTKLAEEIKKFKP